MKKNVSCLLVGYGGFIAVLGLLAHQFVAPDLARPSTFAGLIGGGLSAFWGVLGLLGKPRRGWSIFTLAVTGFVLLSQVVTHWMSSGELKPGIRMLAVLATIMLLTTFAALMIVVHAAVPNAGSAGNTPTTSRPSDDHNSSARDDQAAWKEARRHRGPPANS